MDSVANNTRFDDHQKHIIKKFHQTHGICHLLRQSGASKARGIPVARTFLFLFSIVFTGKSLFRTLKERSGNSEVLRKDVVYRFLQSPKIDWIGFLTTLSAKIITQFVPLTDSHRRNVFIIDDSIYERSRSKKVELLAKVYDHAKHIYGYGYRMLTLGWSDGNSFIPVNFCLMSSADRTKQLSPERVQSSQPARQRRILAQQKAPDTALAMLQSAKQAGIQATHVLFDSWFSFPAMILQVFQMGYHTVAMVKKSKKVYYEFNGKRQSVKDIFRQCRKRRGRSRYLLSVEVGLTRQSGSCLPTRLVFVRNRNNRKDYLVLLCTDMTMNEDEIIQIYGKRWAIEVFFKVTKSYLRLVKGCSSLSYDAVTAHTSIVFVQYMMLAEHQRLYTDQRSIGDLFYEAIDELSDLAYEEAFILIITAIFHAVSQSFALSEHDRERMVHAFIATMPPALSKRLKLLA